MIDLAAALTRWELDLRQVRARMYRAPTPRARWHARWLLAQGWPANKVAEVLEREAHTIGSWLAAFDRDGPAALAFEQTGPPRPRPGRPGRAEGRGAGDPGGGRHRPGERELEGGAPGHRGALRDPPLPQRLPAYRPDCNPDEAIWAWAREEVTANTCLGIKTKVQERMAHFFDGLAGRTAEVQSRCCRKLQALAETVILPSPEAHQHAPLVDPIGASV